MRNALIDYTNVDLLQSRLKQLDLNKKNILIIEPYGASVALVQRGIENGYNLFLLSADTDLRILPSSIVHSSAMSIRIDTSNESQLIDLITHLRKEIEFDAVIPGFEYFVPAAATLSSMLSLPGIDCNHVMNLRRKDFMRSMLQRANVNVPNYVLLDSIEDLDVAAAVIGFPMVCKPVDAAGSVNVKCVHNKKELRAAASRILHGSDVLWGYELSKLVLIEQYITGVEYSLEGVIVNGRVHHFSVTEKFVSDQSDFIEIGHIANVPIDPLLKLKMERYIERVIEVLGASDCPFHAELRINDEGEPVLMEIAARLAGDKIGELINLSRSINYYDFVYSAYLGEEIELKSMINKLAGIRFFYRPAIDDYSSVNDLSFARHENVSNIVLYYQPGEKIPSFPKPLRRLGHVIAVSEDYQSLRSMLDAIDNQIEFVS